MENSDRKKHWETIYNTKQPEEVGWFQQVPATSLAFIERLAIGKSAKIIDVGGGDGFLVDHLLDLGYSNISVLDISEAALLRAQNRLGEKAKMVTWIVADLATFKPVEKYDFWHDRAAFHFLINDNEIEHYIYSMNNCLRPGGMMVVGTFSEQGPRKCSGIEIKQYSESSLTQKFSEFFEKIECVSVNHTTPFDTVQNFVFCGFRKPMNNEVHK